MMSAFVSKYLAIIMFPGIPKSNVAASSLGRKGDRIKPVSLTGFDMPLFPRVPDAVMVWDWNVKAGTSQAPSGPYVGCRIASDADIMDCMA